MNGKPLTLGELKQICADAGMTDDTEVYVDSGWIKAVDANEQAPWVAVYEASPNVEGDQEPQRQFVVLS